MRERQTQYRYCRTHSIVLNHIMLSTVYFRYNSWSIFWWESNSPPTIEIGLHIAFRCSRSRSARIRNCICYSYCDTVSRPSNYRMSNYRMSNYRVYYRMSNYRMSDYRTSNYRMPNYWTSNYRMLNYRMSNYQTSNYWISNYWTLKVTKRWISEPRNYRTPNYWTSKVAERRIGESWISEHWKLS